MDLAQAIGVLGGVLASVLAVIKLWEYRTQRPRFDVHCWQGNEQESHFDCCISVVKRGSPAVYLSRVGLAFETGAPVPRSWTIGSGEGLREEGFDVAMAGTEPRTRTRRWRPARRGWLRRNRRVLPFVMFLGDGLELPRLMQLEGETVAVRRCGHRLVEMIRMHGGPPTYAVAVDALGRSSWCPVPDVLRGNLLRAAMDDSVSADDSIECPTLIGGLFAPMGDRRVTLLRDDRDGFVSV